MEYKVYVTIDAENDLNRHVLYLLKEKRSRQAVTNLLDDFVQTKEILAIVAGCLQPCKNQRLRNQGYKRINFLHHDYFMIFRIEDQNVFVDGIYHFLEDYENKIH